MESLIMNIYTSQVLIFIDFDFEGFIKPNSFSQIQHLVPCLLDCFVTLYHALSYLVIYLDSTRIRRASP